MWLITNNQHGQEDLYCTRPICQLTHSYWRPWCLTPEQMGMWACWQKTDKRSRAQIWLTNKVGRGWLLWTAVSDSPLSQPGSSSWFLLCDSSVHGKEKQSHLCEQASVQQNPQHENVLGTLKHPITDVENVNKNVHLESFCRTSGSDAVDAAILETEQVDINRNNKHPHW